MIRLAVLGLLVVALAACGDDASDSTSTTAAATTTTSVVPVTTAVSESPSTTGASVESTTTTAPTTTTTLPDIDLIDIDLTVGDDPGRVEVVLGRTVRITVAADVTDEVHLHGYNIFADVAPGSPAVIEFLADIEGIFDVELEDARQVILELKVAS